MNTPITPTTSSTPTAESPTITPPTNEPTMPETSAPTSPAVPPTPAISMAPASETSAPAAPAVAPITPSAVPPSMPSAPSPAAPAQKKGSVMPIVVGALALALTGGGLYLGSQYLSTQQDNRQQAYVAPDYTQESEPAKVETSSTDESENPNIDTPVTTANGEESLDQIPDGTVAGKICPAQGSTNNRLTFYNLTLSTQKSLPVTTSDTTYKFDVRPGKYKVALLNNTEGQVVGYTSTNHQLKEIEVPVGGTVSGVDVCDTQVAASSLPKGTAAGE